MLNNHYLRKVTATSRDKQTTLLRLRPGRQTETHKLKDVVFFAESAVMH